MNAKKFITLRIIKSNQVLDQEDRLENPLPIVDWVINDNTGMVYIVDYENERYQEAQDGTAYSDWKEFLN